MLHKLFLLILFPVLFQFTSGDNLIEWSASRKLTWEDFKAAPDPASKNAALTNSTIKVEFGYSNKGLTHTIKCRFNKLLSWGRIKNDYILKHEQGHFDLAEAHARLLHKNLGEYIFNSKSVSTDVSKIYDETMKRHALMQQEYDVETNHSLDSAKQTEWDKKISAMLKEYEKYADYKFAK